MMQPTEMVGSTAADILPRGIWAHPTHFESSWATTKRLPCMPSGFMSCWAILAAMGHSSLLQPSRKINACVRTSRSIITKRESSKTFKNMMIKKERNLKIYGQLMKHLTRLDECGTCCGAPSQAPATTVNTGSNTALIPKTTSPKQLLDKR